MNNRYIAAMMCIMVLTLAPACKKKQPARTKKNEEIKTMIELDDVVFEIEQEDTNAEKSIAKF